MSRKLGREALEEFLEKRDEQLERERDAKRFVLKDIRRRKVLTLLGEIIVKRRYYWDRKRSCHCALLDKEMGLEKESRLSPTLKDWGCRLATEMSYAKASEVMESFLTEAVSRQSIWQAVQELGGRVEEEEQQEREAVFEKGKEPEAPLKTVECLFGEADGCMISLQRENARKGELKAGVWYEGWKKKAVAREEFELVGKHYVVTARKASEFWEGTAPASRWIADAPKPS